YRAKAYQDTGGVWTIGYGTTDPTVAFEDNTITEDEAEQWLANDLAEAEAAVRVHTKIELTQEMFDALVSFVYNVGPTAYKKSTLLKKLNKGDYLGAADEFPRWNKDNGKVVRGLTIRRAKERAMFL